MQINPATKVDLPRTESAGAKRVATRPAEDAAFAASDALARALAETPDVRPEALDRARALGISTPYPPEAMIDGIANLLAQGLEGGDSLPVTEA
ncbi:MAG: hypothetical protein RJA22_2636 [Verrucomicrobiota bacterium]|jgi:hypothetical protein